FLHGHSREGRRWLEEAMEAGKDAPARLRASALHALGHMAQQESDHRRAIESCEESLALYREAGDQAGIVSVLQLLAFSNMLQGYPERAIAFSNEAVALGADPALRSQTIRTLYVHAAVM